MNMRAQDHFRKVTGLPINPYFSAYKFAWLLENVQGVKSAVEDDTVQFGTIDTYLIWRLTGRPAPLFGQPRCRDRQR
jgi:glycerol kinase